MHKPFNSGRRVFGRESGQALALCVLVLMTLLGMCALVIDVGSWYATDRRAQSAADAAALAAAARLPDAPSIAALNGEGSNRNHSNFAEGTIGYAITSTAGFGGIPDIVTATAETDATAIFAKLFGIDSVHVRAAAEARLQTYTSWGGNTMPWGISDEDLVYNVPVNVKVDDPKSVGPGNFGALDLIESPGCSSSGGANSYQDMISGASRSCKLTVGGPVAPKTGNMAGPTDKGLTDRGVITPFDPYTIVVTDGPGRWKITDLEHPNVGVIPIVDRFYNGSGQDLKVVGFAWFVITEYGKTSGKAWVKGIFVNAPGPSMHYCPTPGHELTPCETGNYTVNGITAIRLTG